MKLSMQPQDIVIAGVAVGGAVLVRESGQSPEWISQAIAALIGSSLAAGFRLLDGQLKGWRAGVLAVFAGAFGGYYLGVTIVHVGKFDDALVIPLTFFAATVIAKIISASATRIEFNGVADAIEDRIEGVVKTKKEGGE